MVHVAPSALLHLHELRLLLGMKRVDILALLERDKVPLRWAWNEPAVRALDFVRWQRGLGNPRAVPSNFYK